MEKTKAEKVAERESKECAEKVKKAIGKDEEDEDQQPRSSRRTNIQHVKTVKCQDEWFNLKPHYRYYLYNVMDDTTWEVSTPSLGHLKQLIHFLIQSKFGLKSCQSDEDFRRAARERVDWYQKVVPSSI